MHHVEKVAVAQAAIEEVNSDISVEDHVSLESLYELRTLIELLIDSRKDD